MERSSVDTDAHVIADTSSPEGSEHLSPPLTPKLNDVFCVDDSVFKQEENREFPVLPNSQEDISSDRSHLIQNLTGTDAKAFNIPSEDLEETYNQQLPETSEMFYDEIICDYNDGNLRFSERHNLSIDERFEYIRNGCDPGLVLIFNQENFSSKNLKYRKGSRRDVNEITKTLNCLGFNITKNNIYVDSKEDEILSTLDRILSKDLSEVNCVIVFFLTHGEPDNRIHAFDHEMDTEVLLKKFANCEDLMGKPKLFVFQACRGLDCTFSEYSKYESSAKLVPPCTFKDGYLGPDMLAVYATLEGSISFRSPEEGTWFIQELCRNISAHGKKEDIISILIRTTKCVSNIHFIEEGDVIIKQVPIFLSTLKKKFYLTRSKDRSTLIDLKKSWREMYERFTELTERVKSLLAQCQSN